MTSVLFAWTGKTDLLASQGDPKATPGPIGQVVDTGRFDTVILLWNYQDRDPESYVEWLKRRGSFQVKTYRAKLSSPTNYGDIYRACKEILPKAIQTVKSTVGAPRLTFHVSAGTPAMSAVWIILSRTMFPAELIQSSKERGVESVSLPFDFTVEFVDLLRRPDEELQRLSQGLPPKAPEFDSIIHGCTSMQRLVAKARRVAPRSVEVLLLGESGTGKDLLAQAIHQASPRKDGPFRAVNCGAVPAELFESEFFGYEIGAHSKAEHRHIGLIESSHGGTLFLDEIGELPKFMQTKLLRVLEERKVTRLGATSPVPADFRLIAATNRDLPQEVANGAFREDLFYRIAVAILKIPPLRGREGDLRLLIDHFVERLNVAGRDQPGFEPKKISVGARNTLMRHTWPGNIRELWNTLERAAIWTSGSDIRDVDIHDALIAMPRRSSQDILERPLGDSMDIRAVIDEVARHYLKRAMADSAGNKSAAARLIGLPNHQTLSNWLKRHRMDV